MTIRVALTLSYRALPEPAARLYRLLGLHPGTTFDSRTVAALAGTTRAEVGPLLSTLTDANLLDDTAGGRYRFHDLTRLHARELAVREFPTVVRDGALHRLLGWFLHAAWTASVSISPHRNLAPPPTMVSPGPTASGTPPFEPLEFASASVALDWLEFELRTIHRLVGWASDRGDDDQALRLVDTIWPLFAHRGHHAERLELERLALGAARRRADRTGAAKMLSRVGMTLRALGRLDEAAEKFAEAMEIWRAEGNLLRQAGVLRRQAMVEKDKDEPGVALGYFTEALAVYEGLGETRRVAVTLCELVECMIDLGRGAESSVPLERARTLLTDRDDPFTSARVGILLGRVRTGDPDGALAEIGDGLRLMRELGSVKGQVMALEASGDLLAAAGRREEARRDYTAALGLLVERSAPADRITAKLSRLGPG